MSQDDGLASSLAQSSQDVAALAGLFYTESVEHHSLATQFGFGAVLVSPLSILGLLGLVKGCLKLSLGLTRCRAAGIDLASLRGLLGYLPGESPQYSGDLVPCDAVTVEFTADEIIVTKSRQFFDTVLNPMVTVALDWNPLKFMPSRLTSTTAMSSSIPKAMCPS